MSEQLWHDPQTNKYYLLNTNTGSQQECDRFGQVPTQFKPYTTGYARRLPGTAPSHQVGYTVQPSILYLEKFDGYFQCPRPVSTPYFNDTHDPKTLKPYKPGHLPSTRLADDIQCLPRPTTHLTFSHVWDASVKKPRFRSSRTVSAMNQPAQVTLHSVRLSTVPVAQALLTTGSHLQTKYEKEQRTLGGYQPPPEKEERRKLQGYYMLNYRTSGDLFLKERAIMEVTNPVAVAKQRRYEELDRKNFEQRREQKILQNKLKGT